MKSVNRSSLIVSGKQPFYDWIRSLGGYDHVEDDSLDATVYLIDYFEDEDGLQKALMNRYEEVFQLELSVWNDDESQWPENLSFDLFLDWFDVIPSQLVLDAVPENLEREVLE